MEKVVFDEKNYKTYFHWENFEKLSSEQRKELIEFSAEQIGREKGLHSVHLEFEAADPRSRGYCFQSFQDGELSSHEVRLNDDILTSKNYLSSYQVYNTLNHELEHASQYERASNLQIDNSDAVTLEQRLNDLHYYSSQGDKIVLQEGALPEREFRFDSKTDFQMYRAQACEADARASGYSAVETLAQDGKKDPYLDYYLKTEKAREINNNREMMKSLGMHSRESMAKEELAHLPLSKVSEQDRKRVLEYARQKDYETAKEVLTADPKCKDTEQELRQKFESNSEYADFYKSEYYQEHKVSVAEHKYYSYANYKWASDAKTVQKENATPVGEREKIPDEAFLKKYSGTSPPHENSVDEKFLSNVKQSLETGTRETIKLNPAQKIYLNTQLTIMSNAADQNYMTPEGYEITTLAKGAGKCVEILAHATPGTAPTKDAAEYFGRMMDRKIATEHPEKRMDFTPKPPSQEQIEKLSTTAYQDKNSAWVSPQKAQTEERVQSDPRQDKGDSKSDEVAQNNLYRGL